jgi:hypothetical protein
MVSVDTSTPNGYFMLLEVSVISDRYVLHHIGTHVFRPGETFALVMNHAMIFSDIIRYLGMCEKKKTHIFLFIRFLFYRIKSTTRASTPDSSPAMVIPIGTTTIGSRSRSQTLRSIGAVISSQASIARTSAAKTAFSSP